jgi:hypothetical protein
MEPFHAYSPTVELGYPGLLVIFIIILEWITRYHIGYLTTFA